MLASVTAQTIMAAPQTHWLHGDLPSKTHITETIASCFRFLQYFALRSCATVDEPFGSPLDVRACLTRACFEVSLHISQCCQPLLVRAVPCFAP